MRAKALKHRVFVLHVRAQKFARANLRETEMDAGCARLARSTTEVVCNVGAN
jgi:hypothetical protein